MSYDLWKNNNNEGFGSIFFFLIVCIRILDSHIQYKMSTILVQVIMRNDFCSTFIDFFSLLIRDTSLPHSHAMRILLPCHQSTTATSTMPRSSKNGGFQLPSAITSANDCDWNHSYQYFCWPNIRISLASNIIIGSTSTIPRHFTSRKNNLTNLNQQQHLQCFVKKVIGRKSP